MLAKKAHPVRLKNKRGSTVAEAVGKIIGNATLPFQLGQSDCGTEFYNQEVQQFFNDRGIKHYTSLNYDIKVSVVERFRRTLSSKMFRCFTYRKTYRWVDVLDKLAEWYNNSFHRAISMSPHLVNFDNK